MERRYSLFLTKSIRGYIYGIFSVIIFLYLTSAGLSAIEAGIVVTAGIIINSVLTYLITTHYGTGHSKIILIVFSALLAIGTIGISAFPGDLLKAVFAIIGALGVNPSDNTIFASYEQPIISGIISKQHRRNVLFSIYTLVGYGASSIGAISLNLIPLRYTLETASIFSVAIIPIYLILPKIEGKKLLISEAIKPESKKTARDVSILFSMDAIGGGFVLQGLVAYWFNVRYGINLKELGAIFFVVDIIMAISIMVTPFIAKKIGLVRTMVYSHIPSNVFLMLIPVFPNVFLSLFFLFLRQSLSQMDVPTRQSYLNSIVDADDRSYVVGVSNASRSIAQSTTPFISSYLISLAASSIPFEAGGGIKIIYDVLLFQRFKRENEKYD